MRKSRTTTTTVAIAALAALGLSALTGCGGSDKATAADGKLEKTSIKVGGLPLADYATLYWAQDKGFFKKEGLTVQIVPLQGGPVGIQEVAAGQLDFSFSNTISTSIAQSKGTPIETVVLGSSFGDHELGIFVKPGSPIKTIDDLDGKTVGINTTTNIGDVSFNNLVASEGKKVTPKWVEVPFPEMVDGVEAGSIDAGYLPEPFKSAAEAAGLREVVDLSEGPNAGFPASNFVASKSFIDSDPDTVNAFVDAMYAANKDLESHEAALRAWLPGVAGVSAATAKTMALPHFETSTDLTKLDRVGAMLKQQGLVPDSFDIDKYTYVPKA